MFSVLLLLLLLLQLLVLFCVLLIPRVFHAYAVLHLTSSRFLMESVQILLVYKLFQPRVVPTDLYIEDNFWVPI